MTIFAWVALWELAGIYLYEWIPLAGDKRLYQLLKKLEPISGVPAIGQYIVKYLHHLSKNKKGEKNETHLTHYH